MSHETTPVNSEVPSDSDAEGDATSAAFAEVLKEYELRTPSAPTAERIAAEVRVGARIKGTVVSLGEEYALIEFGGRSEAMAEMRHFRNEDGTVRIAVGDPIELFVVEAADQIVLAPSLRSEPNAGLQVVREARASGVPVTGRVTAVNAGGLAVDLGGARGFCPLSQIESGFCADPSIYVGRSLEFLVTAVEEARGSAVLSRKQLLRRAELAQAREMLAALKPGDERDGRVARLEAFGAFVDLGGMDGLVHVSEIAHARLGHPSELLKVGDQVRVRVLRIEPGKDGKPRISLSIKAIAPDPWSDIETRFAPGSRVQGVVARLTDFGAFVTLAPGIDGLVHVSQVAAQRIAHVKEVLTVGQTVEAVVLGVDPLKKRVSLSIRETLGVDVAPSRVERVEGSEARPERGPRARASAPRGRRPSPERPAPVRAMSTPAPIRVQAEGPAELTTMAIALRKAMEEKQRKQARDGTA
jgi:small subunit ribosomal protein S1